MIHPLRTSCMTLGLALAFLAPGFISRAQCDPTLTAKLTANDAAPEVCLGSSVSISGDTAIASAWGDQELGFDAGAAYIFQKDEHGNWTQTTKLLAADGYHDEHFGWCVALDGDTAVIGAHHDNVWDADSGSAYIFQRDGDGHWNQIQKIFPPDGERYDNFGECVGVDGDNIAIGAPGVGDHAPYGAVYFFHRDMGGQWLETGEFTPGSATSPDYFGMNIAISGNFAILGASGDVYYLDKVGAAYIYEGDKHGIWRQVATLQASDSAPGNGFGYGVEILNHTAFVGARLSHDFPGNGVVYVFHQDGTGDWNQTGIFRNPYLFENGFGSAISATDHLVVVSGFNAHSSPASVFLEDGKGQWIHTATMYDPDRWQTGHFGISVATDGDNVIVGADHASQRGNHAGAAYIYDVADCHPTLTVDPDPLRAGGDATCTATNMTPRSLAYLAYSVHGHGSTYVPLLDVTLDLLHPVQIRPRQLADYDGAAQWTIHVPDVTQPRDIWFQVCQYDNKTNVVATQIMP